SSQPSLTVIHHHPSQRTAQPNIATPQRHASSSIRPFNSIKEEFEDLPDELQEHVASTQQLHQPPQQQHTQQQPSPQPNSVLSSVSGDIVPPNVTIKKEFDNSLTMHNATQSLKSMVT